MLRTGLAVSFLAFIVLLALVVAMPRLQRPKLYGNSIRQRDLETRHQSTKKKIVLIHNFFRVRVDPPASNMLEMTWHAGAAEDAQKWAEACKMLVHDTPTGRWVDEFGSCGQNIFISNVQVPWQFAVKAWFMEHFDFQYGNTSNNLAAVGHYTQMVWYSSHRVGCGFHYCGEDVVKKPFYNYVCNYCPMGNHPKKIHRPYATGKPCEKCPHHCKFNRLCTNSCDYADMWVNCQELNATWNKWLCGDPSEERHQSCRATCHCSNKIR